MFAIFPSIAFNTLLGKKYCSFCIIFVHAVLGINETSVAVYCLYSPISVMLTGCQRHLQWRTPFQHNSYFVSISFRNTLSLSNIYLQIRIFQDTPHVLKLVLSIAMCGQEYFVITLEWPTVHLSDQRQLLLDAKISPRCTRRTSRFCYPHFRRPKLQQF